MDLLSPKTIKKILAKYNAAPLKRLGQNFLINRGVLQKIIEAAQLNREDTVLEIGPGIGTLTQELAKRVKKVVAVEKDRKFIQILKETLKEYKNIKIIQGDILKLDNCSIDQFNNYKLVANLPYYITSPVIRKFLEAENRPTQMILMVQKEVAQRICAMPPEMSLLAVSIQFYSNPKIFSFVSKGSFWPPPKVDSAILRLTPKATLIPGLHPDDPDKIIRVGTSGLPEPEGRRRAFGVLFFKVVKAGFSSPRKQLINNLSKNLKIDRKIILKAFKKTKIDPTQRAETLNINDWMKITRFLYPYILKS